MFLDLKRMTSEYNVKKRCVKKLDFENCIVTNIKTKARGRRKLRARISRVIETLEEEEKTPKDERSPSKSPILLQKKRVFAKTGSPVLIEKQHKRRESPAFYDKTKINHGESSISETSSQSSPVFKLRRDQSQRKNWTWSEKEKLKLVSGGSSNSEIFQNFYQVENFTQESRQNVDISSLESEKIKNKSSGDYSLESKSDQSLEKRKETPSHTFEESDIYKKLNNSIESSKKSYKKNSLLGRLQRALRKQVSEKLLWQHQKEKTALSSPKKFVVIDFWHEDIRFFLKCQSLIPDFEVNYLFVDSQWVPNIKNIKKGSVLQLYPPWQKFCIGNSATVVLLNIICLEVLDKIDRPVLEKEKYQLVSPEPFENDPNSFIRTLFSSNISGLLY